MSTDPALLFQQAVYAALAADSQIQAILGNPARIYDNVPQTDPADSGFPYVQLGELTSQSWDTDTSSGIDHTLTIHTWSRYRGKTEMKTIMGHIYRVLVDNLFQATGMNVVTLKLDYANDLLDPDGITNHGVQRFRALIQGG